MAKRFTDTDKWKKPFIKSLPPQYKLLWFYITDDCDHAGIWNVDLEIAGIRLGFDFDISEVEKIFAGKIVAFDNNSKWFLPSFIEFQYGELNEKNRAHESVLRQLNKYGLLENKGLIGSFQEAKDKDKDKDKDKEQEKDKDFGKSENLLTDQKLTLPKNGFFTDTLDKEILLTPIQESATVEYIRLMTRQAVTETDVGNRWAAFKIAEFSKHQWYNDFESLLSHFRNSYKLDFKNGNNKAPAEKSKLGNKSGGFGILSEAIHGAR